MQNQAVVALDVGGTTIDAACVTYDGLLRGDLLESHSLAASTKEEIVAALTQAIEGTRNQARSMQMLACGIAMPAPFDYEAGVSHMVHKFQAIHGVDLKKILQETTGLPVYFVNDADAFGLGVGWQQIPATRRFVALTIGTGIGAGFIEDGIPILTEDRVPLNGEVWDLPFRDGTLEDYVSARAVVAYYDQEDADHQHSAKEVAELAKQGDERAKRAFQEIGSALGYGLAAAFAHFMPEKVVVGGKVAQSLELFKASFEQALSTSGVPVPEVEQAMPGNMAIWGAAKYALMDIGK